MDIRAEGGITANPPTREKLGLGDLMDQVQSNLELGLKGQILGHPILFPSLGIVGRKPDLRHVEPAGEQPIAFFTGVADKDPGLAVFHFTQGTAVLPRNAYGLLALFDKLATVHVDHALGIGNQRREQNLMSPAPWRHDPSGTLS